MTREQAIICKIYLEDLDKHHTCNEYKLLMGLLEQDHCEDCISRQAVMGCFKKWQPYMATRLFDFEKELSALPSVNPAEKVGQWVYNKNLSTYYGDVYTCSECGERCLESCYDHIDKLPDFCPKCHIKMEVKE